MRSTSLILVLVIAAAGFVLAGPSRADIHRSQALVGTPTTIITAPAQGGGLGGIGGYDSERVASPSKGKKNKRVRQPNP